MAGGGGGGQLFSVEDSSFLSGPNARISIRKPTSVQLEVSGPLRVATHTSSSLNDVWPCFSRMVDSMGGGMVDGGAGGGGG